MIFSEFNNLSVDYDLQLGDVVYLNYNTEYLIDSEGRVLDREEPLTKEFFRFFDKNIATTFISDNTIPYMIVTTEGNFQHLDNVKLTQQTIDYFNVTGLEIYLWETPTIGSNKKSNFVTDGVRDYYKIKSDKNLQELGGYPWGTKTHCYELQAIDRFKKQNNLKNVTVCTGIYKFGKHKTKDVNLSAQCNTTDSQPVICEYNINETYNSDIDCKLICFNKRYDVFRELVAAHLLDKDCKLSFSPRHTDFNIVIDGKIKKLTKHKPYWEDINFRAWENVDALLTTFPSLEKNIKKLNKKQHVIDPPTEKFNLINYADEYHFPTQETKSAFCTVVNECTFAWPYAHVSEKVLMPVKVHRPFLLVAPPYSLEYMKELGFKTFDKWFDESYDTETDHVKRMCKIMIEIDKVNDYTYNECRDMLNQMQDILKHNFDNLKHLLKQKGI